MCDGVRNSESYRDIVRLVIEYMMGDRMGEGTEVSCKGFVLLVSVIVESAVVKDDVKYTFEDGDIVGIVQYDVVLVGVTDNVLI